jgi:choline-glycine betaine transporter
VKNLSAPAVRNQGDSRLPANRSPMSTKVFVWGVLSSLVASVIFELLKPHWPKTLDELNSFLFALLAFAVFVLLVMVWRLIFAIARPSEERRAELLAEHRRQRRNRP